MYCSPKSTPEVARILDSVPSLPGKRNADVSVVPFRGPQTCNSYWSDGSREYYALVDMSTGESWQVPTSHPFFDRIPSGERCGTLEVRELPPGTCLVEGGYFMGKPKSFRLMVPAENLTKLLPAPTAAVSDKAMSALDAIVTVRGGGFRRDEFCRRALGTYSAANPYVAELLAAGLVSANKAGAVSVTTEGRNVHAAKRGY